MPASFLMFAYFFSCVKIGFSLKINIPNSSISFSTRIMNKFHPLRGLAYSAA
ncbi:hypothetical protein HanRHA438_Chr11g0485941 [Helianthus annuus]|nr:hypothetical protein HanRHA438_Chr11g0485941 [Helianthus annuus]